MRSTFNILFYINRSKIKKNGKCPILGRITVDGKVTQFSVKEDIDPSLWSVKEGCSMGNDKSSRDLNKKLADYQQELRKHYNRLVAEDAYVSAENLKSALFSNDKKDGMLLEEFAAHNVEYLKKVGVCKSKSSYNTYKHAFQSLEKFVAQKYGLKDIAFKDLQYSFIEDFEFFLRVNLGFSTNTIFNILLKLKYMVHRAIRKEIIRNNPFANFNCKQEKTIRKWLSKTELDRIMQTSMDKKSMEWARILFIFSTFTGLAFADLKALKHKNITVDRDGIIWIHINREKTGTGSVIPLLDVPREIYFKHKTRDTNLDDKVFNIPCYQTIVYNLKKIEKYIGLKGISFHQSRHSFATTVCLSYGVPIETLSQMMGHKNISTTQIYGKITNQKVEEDMQTLEKRLGNKYLRSEYNKYNTQKPIGI